MQKVKPIKVFEEQLIGMSEVIQASLFLCPVAGGGTPEVPFAPCQARGNLFYERIRL